MKKIARHRQTLPDIAIILQSKLDYQLFVTHQSQIVWWKFQSIQKPIYSQPEAFLVFVDA